MGAARRVRQFFEDLRAVCPKAELATHPFHRAINEFPTAELLAEALEALERKDGQAAKSCLRQFFQSQRRTPPQVALALELMACLRALDIPDLTAAVSSLGRAA